MYMFPYIGHDLQVFFDDIGHGRAFVLHFVCAGHVARPVDALAAVEVHDGFLGRVQFLLQELQ